MKYGKLKLHEKLDYPSYTYTTKEVNDDIQKLFDKVAQSTKLRAPNYAVNEILRHRTLAYTVTIVDDQPVLGSLAWTRPMYNNIIRLCTR